jgi:hypothetical protein
MRRGTPFMRFRAAFFALPALSVLLAAGCAAGPRGGEPVAGAAAAPKYPRRRPGCKLAIHPTAPPALVATWDDLGVAEVACHIDMGKPECLQRLQAEACRMGADIVFDIPENPMRPKEQAIIFRVRVAHTRAPAAKPVQTAKAGGEPAPPPASAEESAGPVIPLTGPGSLRAPVATPDAGAGAAHD